MTEEQHLVFEHFHMRQVEDLSHGNFYCPKIHNGHFPKKNPEGFCINPLKDDFCKEHCFFNLRGSAIEEVGHLFKSYEEKRKNRG
jgi:hypothetical protein